jgi:hypothetical protein
MSEGLRLCMVQNWRTVLLKKKQKSVMFCFKGPLYNRIQYKNSILVCLIVIDDLITHYFFHITVQRCEIERIL